MGGSSLEGQKSIIAESTDEYLSMISIQDSLFQLHGGVQVIGWQFLWHKHATFDLHSTALGKQPELKAGE